MATQLLEPSLWVESYRADPLALPLADRHYNRQAVGSAQFVPPGRCLVLMTAAGDALWVSSWPKAEYVKHQWAGAWVCSCFRNEGPSRASDLILQAVAATRYFWPDVPALGMVTFIDREEVQPTMVHGEPVYGWTFRKAGFKEVGETKGGLLALQLLPGRMPPPRRPQWGLRA